MKIIGAHLNTEQTAFLCLAAPVIMEKNSFGCSPGELMTAQECEAYAENHDVYAWQGVVMIVKIDLKFLKFHALRSINQMNRKHVS